MSIRVKPHHPLAELLAGLLSGIQTVPLKEQTRMKNTAIREAVKWHKLQIEKMTWWIKDMEENIQTEGGTCPECDQWLDGPTHKKDCELGTMLVSFREELQKDSK